MSEAEGTWRLLKPLRYVSAVHSALLIVPAGFVTDFASVPRWPLTYLLAGGVAQAPAALHDHMYQTHAMPRNEADAVFLEAMGAVGISWWRRHLMYRAVRLAGWGPWRTGPGRFSAFVNYTVQERRGWGRRGPKRPR